MSNVKNTTCDYGNKYFQPSHCEVTTIDVGNNTSHLIPSSATTRFNIQYNNTKTPDCLYKLIDEICSSVTNDYKRAMHSSRDIFLSTPDRNTDI